VEPLGIYGTSNATNTTTTTTNITTTAERSYVTIVRLAKPIETRNGHDGEQCHAGLQAVSR
jgi:hypothetical protein